MGLTAETLRQMLDQYLGIDPGPDEINRLLPLLERQIERHRQLQALDLGRDDPRTMAYIADHRVGPGLPPGGDQ